MKHLIILYILLIHCFVASSQITSIPKFGTDSTLEVATWNIENFPKKGQNTIDSVAKIINALDIDIISFQEISDTIAFKQMIGKLNNYQYIIKSSWFSGLAYIYKKDVIKITNSYEIFNTSSYWNAFPRAPLVLEFSFKNKSFVIINNHYKCCGDGIINSINPKDEENRRYTANNYLTNYINSNLSFKKVMLMGDLNDELTDEPANNVFQYTLNDTLNYLFADIKIAKGNNENWSYPSYPSHLDHILITNELFEEFKNISSEIKTIKIDDYLNNGWDEYDYYISDHRPVAIKIKPDLLIGIENIENSNILFSNNPNPFENTTTFLVDQKLHNVVIEIFNIYGNKISTLKIEEGENSTIWDANNIQNGIYFAKLFSKNKEIKSFKIIISK